MLNVVPIHISVWFRLHVLCDRAHRVRYIIKINSVFRWRRNEKQNDEDHTILTSNNDEKWCEREMDLRETWRAAHDGRARAHSHTHRGCTFYKCVLRCRSFDVAVSQLLLWNHFIENEVICREDLERFPVKGIQLKPHVAYTVNFINFYFFIAPNGFVPMTRDWGNSLWHAEKNWFLNIYKIQISFPLKWLHLLLNDWNAMHIFQWNRRKRSSFSIVSHPCGCDRIIVKPFAKWILCKL